MKSIEIIEKANQLISELEFLLLKESIQGSEGNEKEKECINIIRSGLESIQSQRSKL